GESKPITYLAGYEFLVKTGKPSQIVQGYLRQGKYQYGDDEASEETDDDDYQTRGYIYQFYVNKAQTETITDKGLKISADGNTLSFNGSVIAGAGTTNGATNGSVNYSAGNPILWGANSTDPIGGFYNEGAKVYWRAHTLTMVSVPS
ncbi:MAG: hypothetical protein EZS28_049134, partial [Streblomastix strix]